VLANAGTAVSVPSGLGLAVELQSLGSGVGGTGVGDESVEATGEAGSGGTVPSHGVGSAYRHEIGVFPAYCECVRSDAQFRSLDGYS